MFVRSVITSRTNLSLLLIQGLVH